MHTQEILKEGESTLLGAQMTNKTRAKRIQVRKGEIHKSQLPLGFKEGFMNAAESKLSSWTYKAWKVWKRQEGHSGKGGIWARTS